MTKGELVCAKKVLFMERAQAKKHIKDQLAHGVNDAKGMQAYRCPVCGWFHVGHSLGKSRKWHRKAARRSA